MKTPNPALYRKLSEAHPFTRRWCPADGSTIYAGSPGGKGYDKAVASLETAGWKMCEGN